MSEQEEIKKPKKVHAMDKFILSMMEFMGTPNPGKNIQWFAKPEVSELTEIFIECNAEQRISGYLVHDGKIIKILVQDSSTWKPVKEVRFGEMFTTSMAVDNKKGLDLYLKGLYDKKVPKSRKKDCDED